MGVLFPKISDETRIIHIQNYGENNPNNIFPGNKINTSKYNLLTFLPKSLMLQFTRLSNIVFLANIVLQTIPAISTIQPLTATGPLAFVLGLSMLREGYQDYKRHRKDQQVNSRRTKVIRNEQVIQIEWEEILTGQFIRIESDQIIPTDCLLLYSSHQGGMCYVETANLDGENNLKEKYIPNQISKSGINKMQNLKGFVTVDQPTPDLYQFSGKAQLQGKQPFYIDFSNLLLRETVLKNTDYVICMSLYCGHDSKILRNQGVIHHKISNIEKKTNHIQIGLVITLILLCFAASTGYHQVHSFFNLRHEKSYVPNITQLPLISESIITFFTIFLLLNFLIPITLNILIEGIKTFSALFMSFDLKMYDPSSKRWCGILNSSIIQELGVIDCVLTDKTGTLTANQMVFKAVAIKDKVYTRDFIINNIDLLSQNEEFYDFMVGVIICHDVVRDNIKDQYQGSSPDEVCFINFANSIGFRFIGKNKRHIQIEIFGQIIKFQLLDIIAFTPRKMMSVIVKQKDNKNRVILFTKGADSAIYSKANWYSQSQVFKDNIDIFAKDGLRTLVFSKKVITLKDFKNYLSSKQQNKRHFQQRLISKAQFQLKQSQIIQKMQSNLQIIGATGIQDRLQQKVPQTIERLQLASIMVMMITGDKLQTAENIGYLSYLIKENYKVFKITHEVESAYSYLKNIITDVSDSIPFTLIIEGRHIKQMMEQQNLSVIKLYITFFKKAKTIIFCRSSPKEKAIIVKFVKQKMNLTVLAIGDGGNDVVMIEQAHVGVGIVGKQGNTAAAVSDFSIARFHFLDRLVLHHGRWFDYRLSYFFVFFGLKNMTITLILFFYLIDSAYSGNMIISQIYYALYNAFIAVSLMVYFGLYEQDINDDLEPQAYNFLPQFYEQSKQLKRFSYKDYINWSVMAIILAALIYYFIKISLCMQINQTNGRPSGILFFQFCIGFILNIVLIVINYEDINTRTWFFQVAIFGILSVAPTVIYFIIETQLQSLNMYHILWENINLRFICTFFLIISIVYMFKKGLACFKVQYYPTAIDLFKQLKCQSPQHFHKQYSKILKKHRFSRKKSKKQKVYTQNEEENTIRKRRKRLLSIANVTISELIEHHRRHKSARVYMTEDYLENQTQ